MQAFKEKERESRRGREERIDGEYMKKGREREMRVATLIVDAGDDWILVRTRAEE